MLNMNNFKNVVIEDNLNVLDRNNNSASLYHGDHNIIRPSKARLQSSKIARPLAATILGINNTSIPLSDDANTKNYWSDYDALESYLNTKPACYLSLGSDGSGCKSLANAFSENNNCILLEPEYIILDEIEQENTTGKCIDFNLRHNKVCKSNIIFAMLKQKLRSPAVKHRGFIISGLPMVDCSTNVNYVNHIFISEEAYSIVEDIIQIDLLPFIKSRRKEKTSDASSLDLSDIDELEELVDVEDEGTIDEEVKLSKFILDSCDNTVISNDRLYDSKKYVIFNQIKELFKLNPDVLLNVSYPYTDLAFRRGHKYFNYMTNTKEIEPIIYSNDSEIRWPPAYKMNDFNRPIDNRPFNPKYNCKYPKNFDKEIFLYNCNYKTLVNHYVEEKIKEFHPSKIINLDGRRHLSENINYIQERLSYMMNIRPVIIPKPLNLNEVPESTNEFWTLVENFNSIKIDPLTINRYYSPWYNLCPIELHHRRSIQGNIKYSVTFSKYVFLMSSRNAMSLFCKNPRPYLKLYNLEPTCRVIIMGTKSSGKSMIAECLSWIFDAPIIRYTQLLERMKRIKYAKYSKIIFSEIKATIQDKRFASWENLETKRITELNVWISEMSSIFNKYISLLRKQYLSDKNIDLSKYESKLSFLPMLGDLEKCENAMKDNILVKYVPSNLIVETAKPNAPAIDDEDVEQEINAYILSHDLEETILPTIKEIMSDMIILIRSMDLKSIHKNEKFGKFIIDGFPCDPEYWEHLVESRSLPDYTISICENREVTAELIDHYKIVEQSIKSYYDSILAGNDTLIKTKLDHNVPDMNNTYIQSLLEKILQASFVKQFNEDTNEDTSQMNVNGFIEAIGSFKENWNLIKLILEENYKSFAEIEIDEDKSDVQILDEVLLNIRNGYCKILFNDEDENINEVDSVTENEEDMMYDILSFNDAKYLGDTNVYCPVCYYEFCVLWKGKRDLSIKYQNRIYYFSSKECSNKFGKDPTKYQQHNSPFHNNPPIRICVVGCLGSGKSTVSKKIAKELGLLYIDFDYFMNTFLLPRHFKKVGWKYENSFIDTAIDEQIEIELQEDEEMFDMSKIINNENECRGIIQQYFQQGSPLPSIWVKKIFHKLWHDAPFHNTGFVIDGFPKTLTDVENMVANSCVPDVVIEIEGAFDTTLKRLSPYFSDIWENQLKEAKLNAKIELDITHDKWFRFMASQVCVNVTIEDILDIVCKDPEKANEARATFSIPSGEQSEIVHSDPNFITIYHKLLEEHPEPINEIEWPTFEDAHEKMSERWEQNFEINDENIKTAKEYLIEHNIKVVTVDGKRSYDNIFRNALSKLNFILNRCESYLEQTFVVSCDIAEMLLQEGFLFLSTFHRLCPVYIYENSLTILHTYNISKNQGRLYSVIHRSYIYFIFSKENVIKFRKNPLKYVGSDALRNYQQYPLRIGVIGPPKCGKSKLTSKLADRYGLLCVSKGMAIRYILEHMKWTELGSHFNKMIHTGKCIDTELIIKAVLVVLIDFRTNTNGFIFDGFPETHYECCELLKYGIYPNIVCYLDSSIQTIEMNSQREVYFDMIKEKPPYSMPFIINRYNNWLLKFRSLSEWIEQDSQNLYTIDGNNSKWQCHSNAIKKIEGIIFKINYYLNNVDNKAVSVSVFGISHQCFEKKMSGFKNFCPLCLRKDVLRRNGYPKDSNGLVQYKDKFYWICADHLEKVLSGARLLVDLKNVEIPDIPAVVKTIYKPYVYEDGICLVTYAENLPSQKIVDGKSQYAATYKNKIYLFCTFECLQKFLDQPKAYYKVTVLKEFKNLPKLSLKSLPDLGYLEQSVGNIITDACCAVNVIRPKYPGIDSRLSALLYVGLYLKAHNPVADESVRSMYKKSLQFFEYRLNFLQTIGTRFREMKNPFACFPQIKKNCSE